MSLRRCNVAASGAFRWLHLNLADITTRRWIESAPMLPEPVRELLLAPDTHQRALVDGECVACVLHDFERDFDVDTERVGALRLALTPGMMITTRSHPLRSADIVRNRLERMNTCDAPQALDLLVAAITENIANVSRGLSAQLQHEEEAFLDGHYAPTARDLLKLRRKLAQLHRLLAGMRGVFHRLELDEDLPPALHPTAEKLVQRLQALDGDVLGVQSQLRLLREEVDIQAAQRTNQNLYILSIVTALMLPATLVTGIFGMNTGGMPFAQSPHGTLGATMIAMGAAGATYWLLRWMGFMRR